MKQKANCVGLKLLNTSARPNRLSACPAKLTASPDWGQESALGRRAENRDRRGTGTGSHEECRRGALEDEGKRRADEAEEEERAQPAREPEHDADEPGRGRLARLGQGSFDE